MQASTGFIFHHFEAFVTCLQTWVARSCAWNLCCVPLPSTFLPCLLGCCCSSPSLSSSVVRGSSSAETSLRLWSFPYGLWIRLVGAVRTHFFLLEWTPPVHSRNPLIFSIGMISRPDNPRWSGPSISPHPLSFSSSAHDEGEPGARSQVWKPFVETPTGTAPAWGLEVMRMRKHIGDLLQKRMSKIIIEKKWEHQAKNKQGCKPASRLYILT